MESTLAGAAAGRIGPVSPATGDPSRADRTQPASVASVACSDGLDNDNDGYTDYPADQGCTSSADTSEVDPLPACSDGIDNDGDSRTDYPQDPGCSSSSDTDESNGSTACSDGLDNDGDGYTDLGDPGCDSATDDDEWHAPPEPPSCYTGGLAGATVATTMNPLVDESDGFSAFIHRLEEVVSDVPDPVAVGVVHEGACLVAAVEDGITGEPPAALTDALALASACKDGADATCGSLLTILTEALGLVEGCADDLGVFAVSPIESTGGVCSTLLASLESAITEGLALISTCADQANDACVDAGTMVGTYAAAVIDCVRDGLFELDLVISVVPDETLGCGDIVAAAREVVTDANGLVQGTVVGFLPPPPTDPPASNNSRYRPRIDYYLTDGRVALPCVRDKPPGAKSAEYVCRRPYYKRVTVLESAVLVVEDNVGLGELSGGGGWALYTRSGALYEGCEPLNGSGPGREWVCSAHSSSFIVMYAATTHGKWYKLATDQWWEVVSQAIECMAAVYNPEVIAEDCISDFPT